MTAKWSTKTPEQIEKMLNTNSATGLSKRAVRIRHKKCGDNDIYRTSPSALKNYAFHLASDLTSYLLIISAIVAATFNYKALSVVIFVTWIANIVLTLLTYIKAEKTFECAAFYSMPKARVIRDGRLYITDIRNIVRGDVILLRTGDIAPCDIRLVSSSSLVVAEYDEDKRQKLRKKDADARIIDEDIAAAGEHNMVFAGAIVAAGEARGIAVDTGEDTYTYGIMGELELSPDKELSFFEKLGRYCTAWSIIMLVLILPLSIFGMRSGLFDSFMLGLALASSTVSEMLAALGRIIVACSVMNAALIGDEKKNNAIIKNISKIEKMPEVDTLLIFDEGAFTTGEVSIEGLLCDDEKLLLESALISSGLVGGAGLSSSLCERNADDIALAEHARKMKISEAEILKKRAAVGFAPATKYNFDTALVKEGEAFTVYVRGDAELLLPRCISYICGKETRPMDEQKHLEILSFINDAKEKCRRTLIVAKRNSPYNNLGRISSVQNEFTYIGVVVLCDPVISCARETLASFCERGIDVIFAGKTENSELKLILSDTSLVKAVYYTDDVLKKKKLFSELLESGKKIAVVASSVMDIGFFKEAHTSFTCYPGAFNRNVRQTKEDVTPIEKDYGTVAAKKDADVIIRRASPQNYGISSVLSALDYSETVFRNISNMSKYLVCVLAARLFTVLFSVIFSLDIISPAQILFSGLIVDFFAVLVFAFEKPSAKRSEPMPELLFDGAVKKNIFWIILGSAYAVIVSGLAFSLGYFFPSLAASDIKAVAFVSLILAQLVFLGECTSELPIYIRKIKLNAINVFSLIFIVGVLVLFVSVADLGKYMDIVLAEQQSILWALLAPALVFCISEIRKIVRYKRTL